MEILMLSNKTINYIWIVLMLLTIGSALIAESADPSKLITIVIALSIAFKGRMVLDRFMELRNANRYIRASMNIYFYVIPLMIVVVHLFPEAIAELTKLN